MNIAGLVTERRHAGKPYLAGAPLVLARGRAIFCGMRHRKVPPALPLVSLMAAAVLASCDSPPNDRSVRLCRDSLGRRVDDWNCEQRGGGGAGARAGTYVYASERQRIPGIGQAISSYSASPGNGEVISPEGRVVRGGLGRSGVRGSFGG
jgi:hypothetical protein